MHFDEDIKIAGDKPSESIKKNSGGEVMLGNRETIARAEKVGEAVALRFSEDNDISDDESFKNADMLRQRRLLMSFAATVGFEMFINDDTLAGVAQKSFLDTLKRIGGDTYSGASDTGAFSFYYLSFRRGDDIERRIGQTFAMLCSHDGDPIFQELGETLYCWFLSVVKGIVTEFEL